MQASDCSWLYYDSHLLEPILASLMKNPQQAQQLPYIMAAFLDAHTLLLHDPRRAEPRQAEPSHAEPSLAEPSEAGPSQAEHIEAGPSQAQPSQAELNHAEPSQADVPSLTQVKLLQADNHTTFAVASSMQTNVIMFGFKVPILTLVPATYMYIYMQPICVIQQTAALAWMQAYDDQLWSTLETVLLTPLCRHIESGLRLHHHAALLTGVLPLNPNSPDVLEVTPLLQVPALRLSTRVLHIRYAPVRM